MATNQRRVWSDLPVSPGSVLKEEIECRGMSPNELASLMCEPIQVINEIILGQRAITQTTATGIQTALGISAQFWLNLETAYRTTLARQGASIAPAVPIQEDSA